MTHHLDALETRAPEAREAALMAALPAQIAHAQQHSAAFADILQGVDAAKINSRAALAQLPVTRKYELLERQQAQRAKDPFGGFAAIGWKGMVRPAGVRRVYQSPGPIYEPEGHAPDYWRAARAMAARAAISAHNKGVEGSLPTEADASQAARGSSPKRLQACGVASNTKAAPSAFGEMARLLTAQSSWGPIPSAPYSASPDLAATGMRAALAADNSLG